MTENKILIDQMAVVYDTVETDWMGFPITVSNKLTYHHISKKSDGGKNTWQNGALLSKKVNKLLNILEMYRPEIYDEWNFLFKIINESRRPPNEEMREWIGALKKRTLEFRYGEYKNIMRLKKEISKNGKQDVY